MAAILVFTGFFLNTGASFAFAENPSKAVIVEKIEPVYVEKGEINCFITLKRITGWSENP